MNSSSTGVAIKIVTAQRAILSRTCFLYVLTLGPKRSPIGRRSPFIRSASTVDFQARSLSENMSTTARFCRAGCFVGLRLTRRRVRVGFFFKDSPSSWGYKSFLFKYPLSWQSRKTTRNTC